MKILLASLITLFLATIAKAELQFAVEDQVQEFQPGYDAIVDFQPIQSFQRLTADMDLLYTNDTRPAKDIVIIKKVKDQNIEIEVEIEGQIIIFATQEISSQCGSKTITALSKNSFETIKLTLNDHTKRTCKDLRTYMWEASILSHTEAGLNQYELGGNPR